MKEFYIERLDQLHSKMSRSKQRVSSFSWFRLLIFIVIALDIYFITEFGAGIITVGVLMVLFAGFLYIIRHHQELKYRHSVLKKLSEINQNEISILEGKGSILPDGNEFHRSESYSKDLDIFGDRSLFHLINRCFSLQGSKMMAQSLLSPAKSLKDIEKRQQSIFECLNFCELGQEVLAHGLLSTDEEKISARHYDTLLSGQSRKKMKIVRWLPPILFCLSVVLYYNYDNSSFLLYGFLINLVISGLFLKNTNKVILMATGELKRLEKLHRAIEALTNRDYSSQEMKVVSSDLQTGLVELKRLKKKIDLLESRNNLIVGLLFNGTFGFDLHAVLAVDNWYSKNSDNIIRWEESLAKAEVIFSYATFARNNPDYQFPVFEGKKSISGKNIRHPFISENENIGNEFHMDSTFKVMLVTGSNMSGKSTFLRAVGVNQILASAGSVVAAEGYTTDFFQIYTSFRKSDSIQESTSLFYDELKRLKMIFSELENTQLPSLVLLDEILRGTNSDDKYYGSHQVLLKLKDKNAITVLATHDLNLSKLENHHSPTIQNYSFESEIKNGDLLFDYKLRKGVAKNKNATFLMEKMGII